MILIRKLSNLLLNSSNIILNMQLSNTEYLTLENKRKFWLLILISICGGTFFLTPFLLDQFINQIQSITGASLIDLQLLFTIYGVISLVTYIPGGWIADRFSPKLLITISMSSATVLTLWYSLVGFNNVVDYSQLVIIYILYALVNSLIFWNSFIKSISLFGGKNEQNLLYSKSEIMRNLSSTCVAFVSIGLLSATIASPIFNKNNGDTIFIILFIYSIIFLILTILIIIFLPGKWIYRKLERDKELNIIRYQPMVIDETIIVKSEEELRRIKNKYTRMFWTKVGDDFKQSSKTKSVWLISLLVFFIMNAYAAINAFITIFSKNFDINDNNSTIISYLCNYATPIIGSLMALYVSKKIKKTSQSLFIFNIVLCILMLIMIFIPIISLNSNISKQMLGIFGVILLSASMIFIGANRSIYWALSSESKIPISIIGIAAGIVSVIGFSENIWVNPLISSILKPFAIENLGVNIFRHEAFVYIYLFSFVNCLGALFTTYLIFQNNTIGKIFTKNQTIKYIFKYS